MELGITTKIKVTDSDIDDIMSTALEGGITYWCGKAEVVGGYLGEYASEQISHSGELKLYDAEDNSVYTLTKENFLKGLTKYIERHPKVIYDGGIDAGNIDAEAADCIIQYAIFDKLVYG